MSDWVRDFFTGLHNKIGAGASVADLRAYIGPFPDQFDALFKEAKSGVSRTDFRELEATVKRLQAEAESYEQDFQAQYAQLERERDGLLAQLAEALAKVRESESRQTESNEPSEKAAEILGEMATAGCPDSTIPYLAFITEMHPVVIQHYLEELTAKNMLQYSTVCGNDPNDWRWELTAVGRAFVVKRGVFGGR